MKAADGKFYKTDAADTEQANAANRSLLIFTTDAKFKLLAKHLPVRLYQVAR
jgi:hypothetical protein